MRASPSLRRLARNRRSNRVHGVLPGEHGYGLIVREIGDRRGEGNALGSLGNAYAALGDTRGAIGYYMLCPAIHCEVGDRGGEAIGRLNLALLYAQQGEKEKAREYATTAAQMFREMGHAEYAERACALVSRM